MGFRLFFLNAFLPLFVFASNLNELINLSLKNEDYLIKELALLKAQSERKSAFRAYLPELSLQGAYVGNSLDRFASDPKESLFTRLSLKL